MAKQNGVVKAENLEAYVRNTPDSDIITGGGFFDTQYKNLTEGSNGVHYHKSLDFSNVGMPTSFNGNNDAAKRLRQFHQTRLYIMDYDGILGHGKELNAKNKTYLISANLPESFSYEIGSEWKQPFQQFSSDSINGLIQLGGKDAINTFTKSNIGDELQSTVNRVSTIMAWNGSKPLSLSLEIPVIDDGHPNESVTGVGLRTNLVESLEFLGSLCLPKGGVGHLGFYQPPPSPYDFTLTNDKNETIYSSKSNNHARIMLQLGGMLLVDNVIVTKVRVNYPNTKTMIRHWYSNSMQVGESGISYLTPLLAKVTIDVTTSEALTKQTYSNMLWLKQQEDQGSFSYSTQEIKDMYEVGKTAAYGSLDSLKSGGNYLLDFVKNYNTKKDL